MLDVSTFRVLSSSHLMDYIISGQGRVEFIFNNINLVDSTTDEPNSHGAVKYSIKCKESLTVGQAITNTAYIFFDFSPAVVTNTTTTLIAFPVHINSYDHSRNNKLILYPNPAGEFLNLIYSGDQSSSYLISLYNNVNLVYTGKSSEAENRIDVSNFPAGIYYGTILNDKGVLLKGFRFIIAR